MGESDEGVIGKKISNKSNCYNVQEKRIYVISTELYSLFTKKSI